MLLSNLVFSVIYGEHRNLEFLVLADIATSSFLLLPLPHLQRFRQVELALEELKNLVDESATVQISHLITNQRR